MQSCKLKITGGRKHWPPVGRQISRLSGTSGYVYYIVFSYIAQCNQRRAREKKAATAAPPANQLDQDLLPSPNSANTCGRGLAPAARLVPAVSEDVTNEQRSPRRNFVTNVLGVEISSEAQTIDWGEGCLTVLPTLFEQESGKNLLNEVSIVLTTP